MKLPVFHRLRCNEVERSVRVMSEPYAGLLNVEQLLLLYSLIG